MPESTAEPCEGSAAGNKRNASSRPACQGLLVACLCLGQPLLASAFTPKLPFQNIQCTGKEGRLWSSVEDPESDISRQLAWAKELLEKSKAKLAAKEAQEKEAQASQSSSEKHVPFFAALDGKAADEKRKQVIKSEDEETGLITTDGEMMAKLSEEEKWEVRSLLDVFENEIDENGDVYSERSRQLAERDVAAHIRGLRMEMNMEDFKKIFDPRNRFIGEDS